jgi:hypothetical protein
MEIPMLANLRAFWFQLVRVKLFFLQTIYLGSYSETITGKGHFQAEDARIGRRLELCGHGQPKKGDKSVPFLSKSAIRGEKLTKVEKYSLTGK